MKVGVDQGIDQDVVHSTYYVIKQLLVHVIYVVMHPGVFVCTLLHH